MSETGREKTRTELRNEIAEAQMAIARLGGYQRANQSAEGITILMKLYRLQDQDRELR